MKIYHYTPINRWYNINPWDPDAQPGLKACLGVCAVNSEDIGASNKAIFGLLDPTPENWINNSEFPVAWRSLMTSVGKLLLTYEPTDEIIDKSFVLDWSHREDALGGRRNNLGHYLGRDIPYEDKLKADKAYWASRVPLAQYIEDPQATANMALPEIITMCAVPLNLVEVASTQPRLHNLCSSAKQDLRQLIQYDSGLKALAAYTV